MTIELSWTAKHELWYYVTLQESAQKVKKKELLRADLCFEVYQRCTRQRGNTIPRMNGGERKRRQSYVEGIFVDVETLKI